MDNTPKTFSTYFNLTEEECKKLSDTEYGIAQSLASRYPKKFKDRAVVTMLKDKKNDREKPVLLKMITKSNQLQHTQRLLNPPRVRTRMLSPSNMKDV